MPNPSEDGFHPTLKSPSLRSPAALSLLPTHAVKQQPSIGQPARGVQVQAAQSTDAGKGISDPQGHSPPPMGPMPGSLNTHAPERPGSSSSSVGQNGQATGSMNSHVEYRGKSSSLDGATANLLSREGFSLDDEPADTPSTPVPSNHSFWQLPVRDRRNFLVLVLLYFLQGIPMGLATGSVPFILKSHLSYSQIGIFSLASYPYSLKLLWSPIVDAVWSARVGRRKSWILPIQMLSGVGMLWLGARAKRMMVDAEALDGSGVWAFTGWWFFLVFMCATQDIAVDGETARARRVGRCRG